MLLTLLTLICCKHAPIASQPEEGLHLIFEDDAQLIPGFVTTWNTKYAPNIPSDAAMIYLGGVMAADRSFAPKHQIKTNDFFATFTETAHFNRIIVDELDGPDRDSPRRWFLHTNIAYVLSVRAAKALVDMSDKHGLLYPADHYVSRIQVLVDTPYTTTPHLITNDNSKMHSDDTDIQRSPTRVAGGPSTLERQAWEQKQRKNRQP